jgi:hypothetical protein
MLMGLSTAIAESNPQGQEMRFFEAKGEGDSHPLIVFLDGGPDSVDPTEGSDIGRALAERGVNVALISMPVTERREAARVLASALAFAAKSAAQLNSDPKRIFCLGRGWGGAVAATVVLDPSYLAAMKQSPSLLAGVVTLNADLTSVLPFAVPVQAGEREAAAGVLASLPDKDGPRPPPVLSITQHGSPGAFAVSARLLANALQETGDRIANDIIDPHYRAPLPWGDRDITSHLLLDFVGAETTLKTVSDRFFVEYRAKASPLSDNDAIWEGAAKIEQHPIDAGLMATLERMFAERLELLDAFPLHHYYAVDLLEYLDSHPQEEVGSGDYLITTSIRGESIYLTRKQLEQNRPQLVIGIDDERNLFRLTVGYVGPRDYSWIDDGGKPRPWLVRPLGAFLYVPGGGLETEMGGTSARFALNEDSFRWVAEDPLAPLADLSPPARAALAGGACIQCHAFRGIGGGGHHIGAFSREAEAGLALPLEDYPKEVMERFLYDQEAVAAMMGTVPVPMDDETISLLHDIIAQESEERGAQ